MSIWLLALRVQILNPCFKSSDVLLGLGKLRLKLGLFQRDVSSDFPRIIYLIERGKVDTTPWITHRAPFEAVPNQFPDWVKPETGVLNAMIEL